MNKNDDMNKNYIDTVDKLKIYFDHDENINEKDNEKKIVQKYLNTLSVIEKKALFIAQRNLESSFNLKKSIGYMEWLKKMDSMKST